MHCLATRGCKATGSRLPGGRSLGQLIWLREELKRAVHSPDDHLVVLEERVQVCVLSAHVQHEGDGVGVPGRQLLGLPQGHRAWGGAGHTRTASHRAWLTGSSLPSLALAQL